MSIDRKGMCLAAFVLRTGATFVAYVSEDSWCADANAISESVGATCAVIFIPGGQAAILAAPETDAIDVLRARRAIAEHEYNHRPAEPKPVVGTPCTVPTSFNAVGSSVKS